MGPNTPGHSNLADEIPMKHAQPRASNPVVATVPYRKRRSVQSHLKNVTTAWLGALAIGVGVSDDSRGAAGGANGAKGNGCAGGV
jgi:hypothetical protein